MLHRLNDPLFWLETYLSRAIPARDRIELIAQIETWLAAQKAAAFADLERAEGVAPPQSAPASGPTVRRAEPRGFTSGVVSDAEFDE